MSNQTKAGVDTSKRMFFGNCALVALASYEAGTRLNHMEEIKSIKGLRLTPVMRLNPLLMVKATYGRIESLTNTAIFGDEYVLSRRKFVFLYGRYSLGWMYTLNREISSVVRPLGYGVAKLCYGIAS